METYGTNQNKMVQTSGPETVSGHRPFGSINSTPVPLTLYKNILQNSGLQGPVRKMIITIK
jgi:hypothetical protein